MITPASTGSSILFIFNKETLFEIFEVPPGHHCFRVVSKSLQIQGGIDPYWERLLQAAELLTSDGISGMEYRPKRSNLSRAEVGFEADGVT